MDAQKTIDGLVKELNKAIDESCSIIDLIIEIRKTFPDVPALDKCGAHPATKYCAQQLEEKKGKIKNLQNAIASLRAIQ